MINLETLCTKALFHLSLIANFSSLLFKLLGVANLLKRVAELGVKVHIILLKHACDQVYLEPKWVVAAAYNLVNCVRTSLKRNAEVVVETRNLGNLYIKIFKTDFTYK